MWPASRSEDHKVLSDPRYNGAFRMNLVGAVDLLLLARSLREVAQRQESLRTTFRITADAEIQQVVFPISDIVVDEVDLRTLPADTRAAMLDDVLGEGGQTDL